jgi:prepilin-type N-terminal cleavage/methylation domain-containing protein
MSTPSLQPRGGFTLVEVLIALTLTALIGAALTSVLVSQSRFVDQQEKMSSARQVSRAAMNMLSAELRMVETSGGVVNATPSSITVNVPYAMGLACGQQSGLLRVSFLPTDSVAFHETPPSGFAYRTSNLNNATYVYAGAVAVPEVAALAVCGTLWNINTLTTEGGRERIIGTAVTPPVAVPLFLYRTVTYSFAASASVPGQLALWRAAPGSAAEELAAPFAATAGFRFFVAGSQTSQAAAPGDLTTLRGIEIDLTGRSEREPALGAQRDRAVLSTAIFFRNTL